MINTDDLVIRADLGIIIAYESTATHALESRTDGRGNYFHRINFEKFTRAEDIPAKYRKLKSLAHHFETINALGLLAEKFESERARIIGNEYTSVEDREFMRTAINPFNL